MNKRPKLLLSLLLGVLLSVFAAPAMANGNVWANQPHGGYPPPGYVPQAQSGAGFGMGMSVQGSMGAGLGSMPPMQAPNAVMPPARQPMAGIQPTWPVPPEHPAWAGGYPGIAPGMAPAAPAMIGGLPWTMP